MGLMNYRFSAAKNARLKFERGVSFEDAIYAIENDRVLDVTSHHSKQYRHQEIYIVDIDGYAYVVPFVREKDGVFLKTMFASRDMTKRYLKKE